MIDIAIFVVTGVYVAGVLFCAGKLPPTLSELSSRRRAARWAVEICAAYVAIFLLLSLVTMLVPPAHDSLFVIVFFSGAPICILGGRIVKKVRDDEHAAVMATNTATPATSTTTAARAASGDAPIQVVADQSITVSGGDIPPGEDARKRQSDWDRHLETIRREAPIIEQRWIDEQQRREQHNQRATDDKATPFDRSAGLQGAVRSVGNATALCARCQQVTDCPYFLVARPDLGGNTRAYMALCRRCRQGFQLLTALPGTTPEADIDALTIPPISKDKASALDRRITVERRSDDTMSTTAVPEQKTSQSPPEPVPLPPWWPMDEHHVDDAAIPALSDWPNPVELWGDAEASASVARWVPATDPLIRGEHTNALAIQHLIDYHPWHGGSNPRFNADSERILDLKKGQIDAIRLFRGLVEEHVAAVLAVPGLAIAVVPSSSTEIVTSGIRTLAKQLVLRHRHVDATDCLVRSRSIPKAHLGGSRSVALHLDSIVVKHPERIRERTVLLLDDVCTSGSSLHACVQQLLSAGAAEVRCVAIGRTARYAQSEPDLPAWR